MRYNIRPRSEEEPLPSQNLVESALRGDVASVSSYLTSQSEEYLNGLGAVDLRVRSAELVLKEEGPVQVRAEWTELRTEVTALFAAAHSGHVDVVRVLLESGADVNRKLFRGFPTTAAAHSGHVSTLQMLLEASSPSKDACEHALIEASLSGQSEAVEMLARSSELVGPAAVERAVVGASSRGFVDVVKGLIKNGVDVNCTARILLQSVKPSLHANVDCTPLIAAIIHRQIPTVQCLLEAGANTETLIRVGAWSWDPSTGEEIRVGSCLGEPYNSVFCAVEYFESTSQILTLILRKNPNLLETPLFGRTPLCHAILCQNPNSVSSLLELGANPNFPIKTPCHEFYPIHLAARLGNMEIINILLNYRTDIDAKNLNGDTPLMVSARFGKIDSFFELIKFGADLGLVNKLGYTAIGIANSSGFGLSVSEIITKALDLNAKIKSSNNDIFSPLHFMARSSHAGPLQTIILNSSLEELNRPDKFGITPLIASVMERKVENFRLLVMAGADLKAKTVNGVSVMELINEMEISSKDSFEQVLLKSVLANILDSDAFNAVHYAAKKGDNGSLIQLIKVGFDVNTLDQEGYSALMHASMNGNFETCKVLLSQGVRFDLENDRGETALILAKKVNKVVIEGILMDHIAKNHVLKGEELFKYTREGRGPRHIRFLQVSKSGLLSWGKGNRRNVYCKEAIEGPGCNFAKSGKDEGKTVIFRVLTVSGREVHFEAGSLSSLELWVRGINLIIKENGSKVN
ncbi:hypothetical protein LUZ60_016121 [Juncus effusus]|nr:hypothetical protein LUZ60_016121 [Juncus effusus]